MYNVISKALIDSNILHDEFASVNNALKEYDDIREEIKNLTNIKWISIALNV